MADVKFSQFTVGNEMMIGDEPVGLRPSSPTANFIFNFPGSGIKDSSGNYLFQYGTVGASAVNNLKFVNSLPNEPVLITAVGSDANISISILPKGTGALYLDNLKWPTSDGAPNTFLFTDGAGNLAFTSASVTTSIIGTANQVFANGTSGTPQDGVVTLTLPQNIGTTSSPTFDAPIFTAPILGTPASGDLVNCTGLLVAGGGTGKSSFTAYSVICGGTTSTGALQNVSGVGTSGQVLTSNGVSMLPTWQTPSSLQTGGLINIQVFTTSGTYTPSAGMANCTIICVGGGGAGGGTPTAGASSAAAGCGGGAGSFSQSYVSSATIGVSQIVTVGAAGSGSSNADGGNGGNTSVGTIVIANGGTGGVAGSATTTSNIAVIGSGSVGGVAGTGDLAFTGGSGSAAIFIAAGGIGSGKGGDSVFASGAISADAANAPGNSAVANSGAGGSGSVIYGVTGANQAGGNGGSGVVIIYEYS